MIWINANTWIDESELTFTASRSSGPGGQNVNKVNTRITLQFHVEACVSLSPPQKQRILRQLRPRIDSRGCLHVVSQKHRTQQANRNAAIERFRQLLAEALHVAPVRRPTKAPRGAVEKRLADKKKRGTLKKERTRRRRQDLWDD